MHKFPFLLVFTGLASGGIFLPPGICPAFPWLLPLCLFAMLILTHILLKDFRSLVGLRTLILWIFFTGSGYSIKQIRLNSLALALASDPVLYQGRVVRKPERRQASWRIETQVMVPEPGKFRPDHFRAYLYFPLETPVRTVRPGDGMIFISRLRPTSGSTRTPGFNYQRYLMLRGIGATGFIGSTDFILVPGEESRSFLYVMREYALRELTLKFEPVHASMLQALLMGQRNELGEELKEKYQTAGIIHVLALSGLHAGMVLLLIRLLFRFCPSSRSYRILEAALCVLVLWMYALFAGMPASMIRTAIMFSLLSIGRTLNRQYSGINALFASASFLIITDPFMLYQLGFQLSHLAVLGILVMYRPLFMLFHSRFLLVRYLWSLSCLSLSAQLMVAPLVAYHFKQLPVYFLPANLLAVPLVSMVLLLGFLFLCVSWSVFLQDTLTGILQVILDILNRVAAIIDGLPGNTIVINGTGITDMVFIYILIMVPWIMMFRPGKRLLYFMFSTVIAWMITGTCVEIFQRIS